MAGSRGRPGQRGAGRAQRPGMLPRCRVGNSLRSLQHPLARCSLPQRGLLRAPSLGHLQPPPRPTPSSALPPWSRSPWAPADPPRRARVPQTLPSPAGAVVPGERREGSGREFVFRHLLIEGRRGLTHAPSPVWVPSLFPGTRWVQRAAAGHRSPPTPSPASGDRGGPAMGSPMPEVGWGLVGARWRCEGRVVAPRTTAVARPGGVKPSSWLPAGPDRAAAAER